MMRGIITALVLSIVAGCQSKPDGSFVYQIKMKNYEVEFDGQQKKATIATDHFVIVRLPDDIRVSQGTLSVGKVYYGPVQFHDKISVVGGKVSVNGQERKPAES